MKYALVTATLLILVPSANAIGGKPGNSPIGKTVAEFTLKDYHGTPHSLSGFRKSKLLVVAFLGTECPLAKLYGHRLGELDRAYRGKGVAFLGINANVNDSVTEIAAHAEKRRIEFPVLKDLGNKVADRMGAVRTPEVFLLDDKRVVRYWGRVDDQYGVGYTRDRVQEKSLENAIAELLAGKPVSVPVRKAPGCFIARVRKPVANSPVTYTKHIAPIIIRHCVECHRPGEIAPFSLTKYEEVFGWAETIQEVIADRRMPPWHADPKHGKFANARIITKAESDLIDKWVANGAPKGDPKDMPKLPMFVSGWQLPRKPDLVVKMRETPYTVPAEGEFLRGGQRRGVPYRYFVADPGFKEDKWIRMAEVVPGNRAVVHHILVIVRAPGARGGLGVGGGEFLVGYVPGLGPAILPDGMAKFVPAGSKLVFQMHYTPNGSVQTDLSKVGLVFTDPKKVKQVVVTTRAANRGFRIPPKAADHKVEATTRSLPFDVDLLAFMPHMHLRGKSFSYEARYPDGKKEMLLNVPNYDFNWQTRYLLSKPKKLPAGTRVHCVAHFDNSKYNLSNPDPTATVRWGDQTWHEMMIGYFDIVIPADRFRKITKQAQSDPQARAKEIIRRFDTDGDGKLSKKEVPPRLQKFFDQLDRNKDGFLTADEIGRLTRFLRF
jgi:peroxiredoxin